MKFDKLYLEIVNESDECVLNEKNKSQELRAFILATAALTGLSINQVLASPEEAVEKAKTEIMSTGTQQTDLKSVLEDLLKKAEIAKGTRKIGPTLYQAGLEKISDDKIEEGLKYLLDSINKSTVKSIKPDQEGKRVEVYGGKYVQNASPRKVIQLVLNQHKDKLSPELVKKAEAALTQK